MNGGEEVGLGFRAHSGWAAMVAVAERGGEIRVVERRQIELADPGVKGFPQPYHAAEMLRPAEAEKLIGRCTAASDRAALAGMRRMIEELRRRGQKAAACGILTGSGRPLPGLDGILASHALIHTAEGVMYRESLRRAAEEAGLPVRALKEKQAYAEAAGALGMQEMEIRSTLAALGKAAGPPWREDQKLAALASWIALREYRRAVGTH